MNIEVMFSSKTDLWETPQDLFDKLDCIHHFTCDVCAIPENAKCETYYTPEQDGLMQEWEGCCWCNPPYGRKISKWVKKAYESKCKTVMLLPARTDTKWFHDYCKKGQIEFLKGRLRFKGSKNSAPFPSMIVVFDNHKRMNIEVLRYPTDEDWKRCRMLALNTVGKIDIDSRNDVSSAWKRKIISAEHSPIRTLMFTIRMEIPYYVSIHFVRHKYGVEHYVSSQRNDRQDMYDRNAARQDVPVTHIMDINAAELIFMARKRLCNKADLTTRQVMEEIKKQVERVCPEVAEMMMPECEYRGGTCHEFQPCGRCITAKG